MRPDILYHCPSELIFESTAFWNTVVTGYEAWVFFWGAEIKYRTNILIETVQVDLYLFAIYMPL
jgi:hypothetical protein